MWRWQLNYMFLHFVTLLLYNGGTDGRRDILMTAKTALCNASGGKND